MIGGIKLIKVKVIDILNARERNVLWLSRKCNLSYNTIYNFVMGKTNAVSYNVLETVCNVLDVEIKDVLEIINKKKAEE